MHVVSNPPRTIPALGATGGLPVLRSTGQTLLVRRSRNFIEEAVIREISERALELKILPGILAVKKRFLQLFEIRLPTD